MFIRDRLKPHSLAAKVAKVLLCERVRNGSDGLKPTIFGHVNGVVGVEGARKQVSSELICRQIGSYQMRMAPSLANTLSCIKSVWHLIKRFQMSLAPIFVSVLLSVSLTMMYDKKN